MKIIVVASLLLGLAVLRLTAAQTHNRRPSTARNVKSQGRTLGLLGPLLGLGLSPYPGRPFGRPNGLYGQFISGYGGGYGLGGSASNYHYGAPLQYGYGYRPSAFSGIGAGSPAGHRPPGHLGYNPSSSLGGALNGPWNGLGNAGGHQSLTKTQAAQLGYALANRIKPLLMAAAAASLASAAP